MLTVEIGDRFAPTPLLLSKLRGSDSHIRLKKRYERYGYLEYAGKNGSSMRILGVGESWNMSDEYWTPIKMEHFDDSLFEI